MLILKKKKKKPLKSSQQQNHHSPQILHMYYEPVSFLIQRPNSVSPILTKTTLHIISRLDLKGVKSGKRYNNYDQQISVVYIKEWVELNGPWGLRRSGIGKIKIMDQRYKLVRILPMLKECRCSFGGALVYSSNLLQ